MKLELFKNGVQEAIREFISISFEKADINDLISGNPNFQQLQYFDPNAVFKSDLNSLQMGQMLSFMNDLQKSIAKLDEKISQVQEPDSELVNRLLKVKKGLLSL